MLTSFCGSVDSVSFAVGAMRNTHEITPMPIATMSESMTLSRSRPGFRLRTMSRMPAISGGYTDR